MENDTINTQSKKAKDFQLQIQLASLKQSVSAVRYYSSWPNYEGTLVLKKVSSSVFTVLIKWVKIFILSQAS